MLAEVEPRTLEFFVQQGIARELLFYLFTDKLIEERGGKKREFATIRSIPASPIFKNMCASRWTTACRASPSGRRGPVNPTAARP